MDPDVLSMHCQRTILLSLRWQCPVEVCQGVSILNKPSAIVIPAHHNQFRRFNDTFLLSPGIMRRLQILAVEESVCVSLPPDLSLFLRHLWQGLLLWFL